MLKKTHHLAVPLLGTDFLRANQGEIKFSPDFQVFLNGQQIGEIDKTVGAQSTLLGDDISISPISTYLAGNISASHTSLDQADARYASITGNYDYTRPNQAVTLDVFNAFVGNNRLEKITYKVQLIWKCITDRHQQGGHRAVLRWIHQYSAEAFNDSRGWQHLKQPRT